MCVCVCMPEPVCLLCICVCACMCVLHVVICARACGSKDCPSNVFFVFCCISLRQDPVSLSWKLEVLARLGQLAVRGYRHMQPAHSLFVFFLMDIRDLISDTHAWTTSTLIL